MEKQSNTKSLGLASLVAVTVGISVSQIAVVGALNGIGILHGYSLWVIAAAFISALLLALTYVTTFAELALLLPTTGGLSAYTEVAIGTFPALVATYSGYLVVNMFGLPAELILFDNITREIFDVSIPPKVISLGLLAILTYLNIRGTDVFAKLQNATTLVKVVFVIATGALALVFGHATNTPTSASTSGLQSLSTVSAFATCISLFFWCFVAAELVCPLIEFIDTPERVLPKSMFLGVLILAALYAIYVLGAVTVIDANTLSSSTFPHLVYANSVFGALGNAAAFVLAITATIGLVNGILAGVSQMLYGMALKGQAFPIFAKKHSKYGTPWVAILFMSFLSMLPVFIFGTESKTIIVLAVAASTCWLFAYIIGHINLVVLRYRNPETPRPYRSPLFPLPQIIGIAGMSFVIWNNPIEVLQMTGVVIILISIVAAVWIKVKMKRSLFKPEPIQI